MVNTVTGTNLDYRLQRVYYREDSNREKYKKDIRESSMGSRGMYCG